jgi:hypothetical protein
MVRKENWVVVVAVGVVGVLVVVVFMQRMKAGREREAAAARRDPFTEAKAAALEVIRGREVWPESAVGVCEAYWAARGKKDYDEMAVLWPGLASLDLVEMCKDDGDVQYVFGEVSADDTAVPYAAKGYYDANKTYNLTMRLTVLYTEHGPRYFVVSAN